MSNRGDDLIATLRTQIEGRLREQLQRHQKINPHSDWRQIVDIQINQECERLERMSKKFEDQGQQAVADVVHSLIDDYLPELSQQLKKR